MARPLTRRSRWGAGLALLASAGAASAQIGETNNSTNSPLVGAKYNDMNTPEAAALLRERDDAAARADRKSNRRRAVAAKATDVVVGADVRDSAGELVGKIVSLGDGGAVVEGGGTKASVPLDAFGKDRDGLVLGITKAQFATAVASAQR